MGPSSHPKINWFEGLIARYQELVGRLEEVNHGQFLSRLSAMIEEIPVSATTPQLVIINEIILRTVGRLLARAHIKNDQRIAEAFFSLAATDSQIEPLGEALLAFTHVFVATTATKEKTAGVDRRIDHGLSILEQRHADPTLTLSEIARLVNLSPWHFARLIKRETGHSFFDHVHRVRVTRALYLVRHTDKTMKEIASAVGYSRTSLLDGHFKRVFGSTPTELRRQGPH